MNHPWGLGRQQPPGDASVFGRPGREYPHEFVIDLGKDQTVGGLIYVPRSESNSSGRVKDYEVCVSENGKEWGKPLTKGTWSNDATTKYAPLSPTRARYVKLRGLSEVKGQPYMSAAEIVVDVE